MSDIVFCDTETLGLDPKAPIWESAAIRRRPDGHETSYHCLIEHRPDPWLEQLPDQFKTDYLTRYRRSPGPSWSQLSAARLVYIATESAHIVGNVPNFDTERLERLLKKQGYTPAWHYHLIDVENLIVGYLRGQLSAGHPRGLLNDQPALLPDVDIAALTTPPWNSDELSNAIGVDPTQFERHTAMGDVLWGRAQYDAMTQNSSGL